MISKIKKTGWYEVQYKGKKVINYSWREPLNKEGWVLVEDEKERFCPLPNEYLIQLLDDPEVKIVEIH